MSVIGEQIKKIRTEKGITQEQLGELIGVTTQAVSRWYSRRGAAAEDFGRARRQHRQPVRTRRTELLIGSGKKAVLYVSGGRLPLCTEYLLGNRNRTYEGFVDRR